MAQHDYAIANGSGSAVRSDLNNALAAIVSHNSGTSEPTTTYAYMPWADTSAGVMKLRNGANNAWITLYQLDGEYTTIPLENGTAAAPSLYFKTSGTDTGLYSPGTDQVAISTAGTGRLFVGSDGKVGIGTSSPSVKLEVSGTGGPVGIFYYAGGSLGAPTTNTVLTLRDASFGSTTTTKLNFIDSNAFENGSIAVEHNASVNGAASLTFATASGNSGATERLRITSDGKVGIGTTSPGSPLTVEGSAGNQVKITYPSIASYFLNATSGGDFAINKDGTERARIDSSGRLLVGTSSARNTANTSNVSQLQIEAAGTYAAQSISTNSNDGTGAYLSFVKSRGTTLSSSTLVSSGDAIGLISFDATDGTSPKTAAYILASVDATPGANDMPGRLGFSTTADGESSPTERLRISNNGQLSAVIPGNSTLYPGFMARAWVNFDGTGTVAIRASGNVSSITDNGVGDYTVNFTTAMVDANYAVTQAYTPSSSATYVAQVSTMTASSVRMGSYLNFTNGTNLDQSMVSVAIFR